MIFPLKKKRLWSNFISAVVCGHNRRNAQRTRGCEKRESGFQRNMRVVLARIRSFLFFFIIISEGAFTLLNAQKEQRRKLKKATRERLNSGERGKKNTLLKEEEQSSSSTHACLCSLKKAVFLSFFFFLTSARLQRCAVNVRWCHDHFAPRASQLFDKYSNFRSLHF